MITFLKVISWVGIGLVALGLPLSVLSSYTWASTGQLGSGAGYAIAWILAIVGGALMLTGGFIPRPRFFWPCCIIIGVLYISSLYGWLLDAGNWAKTVGTGQSIWSIGLIIFPGSVFVIEGLALKLLSVKQHSDTAFFNTLFFRISAIILSALVLTSIIILCLRDNSLPQKPGIISDGKGGAIVAWFKKPDFVWMGLTEHQKLYVQHVDSQGRFLWGKQGKEVYAQDIQPETMHLSGDNQGGAIIAWSSNWRPEDDASTSGIYIQKLDVDGNEVWTGGGIKVSPGSNTNKIQYDLLGVNAGSSNSIFLVCRTDETGGSWETATYAQMVDSNGKCSWGEDGKAIQNTYPIGMSSDRTGNLVIIFVGKGESIVAGIFDYMYAQKFDAAGTPLWDSKLPVIKTEQNVSQQVQMIDDGSGNLLLAYTSSSGSSTGDSKLYLQKIDPDGIPQWYDYQRKAVCPASSIQIDPNLVGDGNGGCIIAWHDIRDLPNCGVYAQRINSMGKPVWKPEGVAIWGTTGSGQSTTRMGSYDLNITSDNNSGAIVVWQVGRASSLEGGQINAMKYGYIPPQAYNFEGGRIFAQKLSPDGNLLWGANGVSVYQDTSLEAQSYSSIISDGNGGAIIGSCVITGYQHNAVYLQRIGSDGKLLWGDQGITLGP